MPILDDNAFVRVRDVVRIVENMPGFRGNVHNRPVRYFDTPSGDGITVQNRTANLTLGCSGGAPDAEWPSVPFDEVLASAGPGRFELDEATGLVTLSGGDAILELCYKVYGRRIGISGVNSDDAIETTIFYSRNGAAFTDIEAAYATGILDDTDRVCNDPVNVEKAQFEATSSCSTFLWPAVDGDVYDVSVNKLAGSQDIDIEAIDDSNICSFFTLRYFAPN